MFPKDFYREVQVIINILASDKINPHDVLGLTASVAALAVSDIPFDSNLAGGRISKVNGKLIVNPTYEECDDQDFELVLAGNDKKIVMIECASNCVADTEIEKAFEFSFGPLGEISKAIVEFERECGKTKVEYNPKVVNDEIYDRIKDITIQKLEEFYTGLANKTIKRREFNKVVNDKIVATFTEEELKETYKKGAIIETIDKIFKKFLRENILKNKRRVDGRGIEEVREIMITLNPIPRVHGSSMFMRGETQVLNILTLGAPGNVQLSESIEGESSKKYIHHYNAPPYSVGEVGRYGATGRREIGHGALAEKALKPVVPDDANFPYVMRLVSEVMGQNGSSSMGSTCASTVTLMAGGVPIKAPVAGISIGLITGDNDNEFITLTDIMGFEDFHGDMDFKVAGTSDTITAIQMDTKIKGLTFPIIRQSLIQAKSARNKILDIIESIIPKSFDDISEYAPRIESVQIPVDTIGKVVGPGGKVIKQISSDFNVEISIDEQGVVSISGVDKNSLERVKRIVNGIARDPVVGEVYPGKVVRITDFGAFIEIFPGKEGLLHISKISKDHVSKVADVLTLNQIVDVKLTEVDYQGRLNFTMLLDQEINKKEVSTKNFHDKNRGNDRNNYRKDRR